MTEQYTISKDDMRTLQIWSGAYISLAMTHKIIDFDKGMEMMDKLHRIAVMPDTARKEPSGGQEAVDPILDRRFEDLELTVRTNNCLKNAKVYTVRDLLKGTLSDMYAFDCFGIKSCQELYDVLLQMGVEIKLGKDIHKAKAGLLNYKEGQLIGKVLNKYKNRTRTFSPYKP